MSGSQPGVFSSFPKSIPTIAPMQVFTPTLVITPCALPFATGQLENTSRLREARRDIARIKTVAAQKRAADTKKK